jgi:RNA recognition motif-containing protein
MNIYVGNLSPDVTSDDLRQAFETYGQVASANVITDKFSGESRGFGFVEMPSKDEATAAITGMNGQDLKGRAINVNEARPRVERPRSGGGGFGGGRGGQRGGGQRGGGGFGSGRKRF